MTEDQIRNLKSKIQNGIIHTPKSNTWVFILYIVLSLGMTYPLILNLDSAVPNDIGDPLLNTWILAWDSHALLTQPLGLFQANIFYPLPETLAYSEHLLSTALLTLPLQLISAEPVVAYNLSLLLSFPLAAFGMYLLTLRQSRHRSAAFIAGLIFGFAPYRFAAIAHLQLLTFQWLPFALLFLDRILRPSRVSGSPPLKAGVSLRYYFAFGLFLCLQILASWYLALYTGVIIFLYLVLELVIAHFRPPNSPLLPRPPAPLPLSYSPILYKLPLTLLLVLLLTLPFAWPYLGLIEALREARPLSLALSLAAAPSDFLAAAPFNTLFGPLTAPFRARPDFTEENTLFLGPLTSLLASIALLSTLVNFLLTRYVQRTTYCASHFTLHASRFTQSPSPFTFYALLLTLSLLLTFPTPYALLAQLLPATTVVRVPPRWFIPALLALAGLAALGFGIIQAWLVESREGLTSERKRRFSRLLLVLFSGLLLAESWSTPIPLAPVENRTSLKPAYSWLARQERDFGLVELPLHSAPAPEFPEVKRLYASTLGWWPLANGYSGYTPSRQSPLAQTLAPFPGPTAITALQALAQEPGWAKARLLVLVHPGEVPFQRSRWEEHDRWQAEHNPALLPLGQFEGDYLYQVIPSAETHFTGSALAIFRLAEQEIRLLAAVPLLEERPGSPPALFLYWQAATPLASDYTVFIHLRAADGFVRSQADGPPVSGHHPTTHWQPGEIIQDIHPLPPGEDFGQVDHLAIGLYEPVTGTRLPALGREGGQFEDNAVIVPIP